MCESSISIMGTIKSKKRSLSTGMDSGGFLRSATNEQQTDMKLLVKKVQTQISHYTKIVLILFLHIHLFSSNFIPYSVMDFLFRFILMMFHVR